MTDIECEDLTRKVVLMRMSTPAQATRRLKSLRSWAMARKLNSVDVAGVVGAAIAQALRLPEEDAHQDNQGSDQ